MSNTTHLRLVGGAHSHLETTAAERADRFNEALANFVEAVSRASNGLRAMGETWERSTLIVAPEKR